MFGLEASFGARAIKALKSAVTESLYHAILYPDRIQDAMTWRFEAGERLTFHVRVRQAAKVPGPFRRLSPSIALKRNFLAGEIDGKTSKNPRPGTPRIVLQCRDQSCGSARPDVSLCLGIARLMEALVKILHAAAANRHTFSFD
jgi:hypothetical protein